MNLLMDLAMIGMLTICYLLLKWFVNWCSRQVEKP